jgi:hypothetical protein
MTNNKRMISGIAASMLFVASGAVSITSATADSAVNQAGSRGLMLAEAQHQHGQEKGNRQGSGMHDGESHGESGKHRHGQKDNAHGGHGHGGHGGGDHGAAKEKDKKSSDKKKGKSDYAHMIISHTDELKLTNEQLGKIVRLHLKYDKAHEEVKHALQDGMKAFKKESLKPAASDDQLRDLSKAVTTAFNKMAEHHIKERHAIHAVLTEAQKNQLATLKMDHDHDDDHSGHGGGGHGGHGDH